MVRTLIFLVLACLASGDYLSISISTLSPNAGSAFTVTVTKKDSGGADKSEASTVYLYSSSGFLVGTTSISFSGPVSSATSSSLYMTKTGSYTIYAVCSGFGQASDSISVAADSGNLRLTFTTQPSTGVGNANCPVEVTASDRFGNSIGSGSSDVYLNLDSTTASFSIKTATMSSGVATFSSCTIYGTGTFRFIASSSGYGSVLSSSFTVSQTISTIVLTAPSETCWAGTACYVKVTATDTNSLAYMDSGASITVSMSSGSGTITTSAISSLNKVNLASVEFSIGGSYVLTATCSGCTGTATVTTASVTVQSNAFINVKWPSEIQAGTSTTYKVGLTGVTPSGSVTVTLSSSDITMVTTSLTFSAVDTYQDVSITVPYFSSSTYTYSATITHTFSASGTNYASATFAGCGMSSAGTMTLPVYSNNPTVTIDSQLTIEAQGTGTYTISLNIQPTSDVTVSLSISGSVTTSSSSVTFTSSSWSSKSIKVTSSSSQTSVSTTATITHSISTSDSLYTSPVKVPSNLVTTINIVMSSFAAIVFSNDFLNVAYGESSTYTVKLKTLPSDSVTVAITSTLSTITVSPSSLTFTTSNYGTTQTVTVTLSTAATSLTSLDYKSTLTHTASSTDTSYSGLIYETTASLINTCEAAVYDWTTSSTCSATITNFQITSSKPVRCSPGYYYSSSTCTICPTGSSCMDGKTSSTCSAGHYSSSTGSTHCKPVAPGYYYTSTTSSGTATTSGKYTWARAQSSSTPKSCIQGSMCPYTTINAEIKCPLGKYSAATASSCTSCPAGSSCTYIASSTCSGYFYSPIDRNECFKCSGVFTACASSSITLVTSGKKLSSNTISACSTTNYCSIANNFQETTCPLGTYISSTYTSCIPCTSTSTTTSYQCTGTSTTASTTTCTAPTYSWGIYCLGCPWPYYTSSSTCTVVASGKYLSGTNTVSNAAAFYWAPGGYNHQMSCAPGYSCSTGSSKPNSDVCPVASICPPAATTAVITWSAGTYNDETGISDLNQLKVCLPGYKCSAASTSSSTSCTKYEFCPMGTMNSYNFHCRGGTHSTASSNKGVWADCTLSDYSTGEYAQSGYLMSAAAGYFSADMLSLSGCPYGTYTSSTGSNDYSDCGSCSSYGYCPRQSSLPTLCPLGFTITGSTVSSCYRCSAGTLCYGSNRASSIACTAGYFCVRGTYYNSYKMIPGYFISGTNAVSEKSATECIAGYACLTGATSQTGDCTANYYCPAGVLIGKMFGCPAGTYTTSVSAAAAINCGACTLGSACMVGTGLITCPLGFYCPASTQSPEQFACPEGTYRDSTGATVVGDCSTCSSGKYCPVAATQQYSCPYGTYRGSTGAGKLSECLSCTGGYYCDTSGGTTTPTDCGAGYYCDTGATAALKCKRGYYCDLTTMTSTNMYSKSCPAGYLCGYGVAVNPTSDLATYGCPAGYYCENGKFYSIPCRPGTYIDTQGNDAETDCKNSDAGYYLDTYASTSTGTICPAGYYCPAGTTQPVACPAGTYNALTGKSLLSECLVCPAGKYCPYESMTAGTTCPQGSYCVSGVTTPTLCPLGTYGAATALTKMAECTDCTAGKYCDVAGLTAPKGDCAAGYYCKLASTTATPDGQTYGYLCPAGSYCEAGCTTPQSCPAGTFNNYEGQVDSSGCITCPEGFYCLNAVDPFPSGSCGSGYFCETQETSSTPSGNEATVGTFAPGETPAKISCPIGTYQASTTQGSCTTCDPGYYCPTIGMSTKTDCPVGFYCPSGCVDPIPCPPGTLRETANAQSLSDCAFCTAGKYCATYGLSAVTGDCGAGYFCEIGSAYQYPKTLVDETNYKYGPCPKGYYCEVATTSRTLNPCPAGTYNPSNKGTSSSSCLKCTAGRYCSGTANVDDSNLCPEQYYCPESTSVSTTNPCTAGHFCAEESDYEKPCPPGTYSSAAQAITCTDCDAGHYCARTTSVIDSSNICPAGYYCPVGTFYDEQYACPPGFFSTSTGLDDDGDCSACTEGKYCDVYGISDLSSKDCAAGFYCSEGAEVNKPMDDSTYGGICKRGEYCPTGSISTNDCTTGKYCDKDQMSAVAGDCVAGHYCTLAATVKNPSNGIFGFGDTCPKGKYCEAGTGTPVSCPVGTYMPYTGAQALSECIECPPGYVCDTTGISSPSTLCPVGYVCSSGVIVGTTTPCDAGYYCEEGSHEQVICPAGTYQPDPAKGVCIDCSAGKYCEEGATGETDCPSGYYCPENTGYIYSYPCSPGTYNPDTGKSAVGHCLTCPQGKYCETEGLSAPTGDCSAGYYCTTGSKVPNPPDDSSSGSVCERGNYCAAGSYQETSCTAGSYCIKQGLGAVSGQCNSGFYCNAGSITPVPLDGTSGEICAQGTYCEVGSPSETDCPTGTFGAGKGLTQLSDCTDCTPGYYCGTDGLSAPTGQCNPGYYCDSAASTNTQNSCAAGYYCPEGSPKQIPCEIGTFQADTAQSSCDDCTAGKYCDLGSTAGTDCKIGYSCPTGTRHSTEFPCESGYFASSTGQASCTICPAGQVCPTGSSDSSTDCPLYSYCPEGTGTAYICPTGSYNDDPGSLNLDATSDCSKCPAGSYCVDGRVSGECVAGFLCIESSPTPTPFGTYTYGTDCPAGGFCEAGCTSQTVCPQGKFNKLKGGKSIYDCTDCPPGYYCDPDESTPTICPAGYYCPQGVEEPTACPIRTYNSETGQDSENSCYICPGGYMCTEIATSNYTEYECGTIGAYCVEGAQTPTPCPPGTFSNSTIAASIDDCIICTEGFMCPGGSDLMLACIEGTYCPTGSPYPKQCLIGHYCPPEAPLSIKCPKGYYCPKYDYKDLPNYIQYETEYADYSTVHNDSAYFLECPAGFACPEGSFAPEKCQLGYYADDDLCVACGKGTYSNTEQGCFTCDPGFICVKAATKPDPSDIDSQGGYICPSGYYCPAGAASPTACSPGSYNPLSGQSSSDVCKLCPSDTYTDTYGNPTCYPCGSSAYANPGSTTCICSGSNRNYLKSDGTCRCIPGYEFISEGVLISDQDGTEDCFKKVYVFQPKGQIRDPSGTPQDAGDCSSECEGGKGTRLTGVGICECDDVKSIDDICNKGCRDSADSFTVSGTTIYHTSTQETVSLDKADGYYGRMACGEGCKLYSMDMTPDGPQAVYGGGSALQGLFNNGRRLVSSSPGISNPVICISLNDTYIFSVSKDNYPVYQKDSLINTNSDFDYGAFQELKTLMKSDSTNILIFAFTFTEQGIYDFVDSSDSDKHMIISVMGAGQQCQDAEIPIRTRTTSSVLTMGTQSRKNIISDPDWTFIVLATICMIGVVILLILGVYIFEHHRWRYRFKSSSNYRDLQLNMDFEALTKPENDSSSFDESGKEDSEEKKGKHEVGVGVDEMVGNDDIDPMIFKHMQKLLEDQKVLAENTFHSRIEDGRKNMMDMLDKIRKIKKFLRDSLEGLDDGQASEPEEKVLSPEEEVENIINQLADSYLRDTSRLDDAKRKFQEILQDPNLTDKDKKDLLQDFSANMLRLDQALIDEQNKANDILSKRLQDRQAKRKKPAGSMEPIEEEPSSSFVSSLIRKTTDKEVNVDEARAELVKAIDDNKSAEIKKMREDLTKNLRDTKTQRERDELMEDFNRRAKELEARALEDRDKAEADLMRRLRNRKAKQPLNVEVDRPEDEGEAEGNNLPKFFQVEDQEKVEILRTKQDIVRQELFEKQETEKVELEKEFNDLAFAVPVNRDQERLRLEAAMKTASDAEKKVLMAQLSQFSAAPDSSGQKESLQAKLNERKRLRALKEAELRKKHLTEQGALDDKQDDEIADITTKIAQEKIIELINSDMDPEELMKRIKEMIDEKHQIELDQLLRKKQETLTQRQTDLLQDSISGKADKLMKLRHEFVVKRNQIELSALSPMAKASELKSLEKQESDAITQLDYNFVNTLGKDQDNLWRSVEDEFRQRFLELSDRQLHETGELLKKMRELNPSLLQSHLLQAESESDFLKRQMETDYNKKLRELDSRQLEFLKMQGEREQEIDEIRRQLDEAEAKKKEMFEVERMRKEMQEKQRQMIEEMRRRGIRPEQMEEMIKKHQQEMSEWEAAMEKERLRQKEKMQERLNARMAKYQEKMAQKLAKYKEENNKVVQANKEEDKLEIRFPTGKQELIYEPVKQIDTKLRVNPLPVFVKNVVSEYADYTNALQNLLTRVKKIERLVASVDFEQFNQIMDQLEKISEQMMSLKKR